MRVCSTSNYIGRWNYGQTFCAARILGMGSHRLTARTSLSEWFRIISELISVGKVTRLMAEELGFDSRQFSSPQHQVWIWSPSIACIFMQWLPGTDSPRVKRQEHVTYHWPLYIANVKNRGAIHPLPNKSSRRGVQLIKHKENFTFLP